MARAALARTGDFGGTHAGAVAPRAGAVGSLLSQYSLHLGDTLLRHRAELAERASRVEAELSNKIKSEFIANISHELRTPLNSILGFSKMLKDIESAPLKPDQVSEYAEFILGSATNLLAVVNDVITVSKIQSGKLKLEMDAVDVEEALRPCVSWATARAGETGQRFIARIDEGLPFIRADAAQLSDAVKRLLSNAFRFTPENGTAVLTVKQAGGGKVMICISDNGVGMTPEEISIAVIEFGQINTQLDREYEGTGLGLSIAKALTELQGGELMIRSEKGKGTDVLMLFETISTDSGASHAGDHTNAE